MWQVSLFVFICSFCIFAGIMVFEPRTLWSGVSFLGMMMFLALSLFITIQKYSDWLLINDAIIWCLILAFFLVAGALLAFPLIAIITFFIEGIKIIRHEGLRSANLLSMLFSILLCTYMVIWPKVGHLEKSTFSTALYVIISLSALYVLALMVIYALSAILNLIHLRKRRNADYIVVLGCSVFGDRVTPLLAARIDKGIELLNYNPDAVLIMSGGQGPGEDVPEGEAMATYAVNKGIDTQKIVVERESVSTRENLMFSRALMEKEKPCIVLVTTAYHVFRALILARHQGIKCVGFGSRTKWYFTLNAIIREFVGYLRLTWKIHAFVIAVVVIIIGAVIVI